MSNSPSGRGSARRFHSRNVTIERMVSFSRQFRPSLRKYFTRCVIGRPRCTSNWVYTPSCARTTCSRLRSVPRISTVRLPSVWRSSATIIASEYASCPELEAADQIRIFAPGGRAACSAGNATVRTCANGFSSRKKKLSFVVIASMTLRSISALAAEEPCSRSASSSRSRAPTSRMIAPSRVSSRYCFSGPITRPEPRWSSVASTSKLRGFMRASSS